MFAREIINKILLEESKKKSIANKTSIQTNQKILYISTLCHESLPCNHEALIEYPDSSRKLVFVRDHRPGYTDSEFKKYLMNEYQNIDSEIWEKYFLIDQ